MVPLKQLHVSSSDKIRISIENQDKDAKECAKVGLTSPNYQSWPSEEPCAQGDLF